MLKNEQAGDSEVAPPDVYFTEAYGLAETACGSGEWVDIQSFEGRWRMPVHLRSADGFVDAVSPYGYSGIYIDPQLSRHDRRLAWSRAVDELRQRRALSVFIRQSPLVGSPPDTESFRKVVDDHPTVCLGTTDVDAVWKQMEGRSRTSIRKAERLGFTTTVNEVSTSDVASDSVFRALYEGAMRRREAAGHFFFPDAYYEALSRGLGENLLLACVMDASGTPVSAALLMRHASLLHYHLSGASLEAGRNGATNLMLWGVIQWAVKNGIERFHLGGGVSTEDSLFRFKRSFGGVTLSYSAYGAVIDPAGYDHAVEVRATKLRRPVDEVRAVGFFPQFRIGS